MLLLASLGRMSLWAGVLADVGGSIVVILHGLTILISYSPPRPPPRQPPPATAAPAVEALAKGEAGAVGTMATREWSCSETGSGSTNNHFGFLGSHFMDLEAVVSVTHVLAEGKQCVSSQVFSHSPPHQLSLNPPPVDNRIPSGAVAAAVAAAVATNRAPGVAGAAAGMAPAPPAWLQYGWPARWLVKALASTAGSGCSSGSAGTGFDTPCGPGSWFGVGGRYIQLAETDAGGAGPGLAGRGGGGGGDGGSYSQVAETDAEGPGSGRSGGGGDGGSYSQGYS